MDLETKQERLRELRRVVEAIPEHLLYMPRFEEELPCGTVHCAAGWAAHDPYFMQLGMRFSNGIISRTPESGGKPGELTEVTLMSIFDLVYAEVVNLFAYSTDHLAYRIKKMHVLANIDMVLNGKPPVAYEGNLELLEQYASSPH